MPNPPTNQPSGATSQVVSTAAGAGTESSRREFERVTCAIAAKIFEITPEDCLLPECPALANDLSKSGIGLRSRKLFNIGSRVMILVATKSDRPRPYFGIVRQCRYTGKAIYSVGVELTAAVKSPTITRWMVDNHIET